MYEALIVGAGPAGLNAARVLRKNGVKNIAVLERTGDAGGLPRYCGHTGFGMMDFRRVWRGPRYARALVESVGETPILTDTIVTGIEPGGIVHVATERGLESWQARTVLLATGTRETPRGPRLVSGTRPWGVTTTGAFQEMVMKGLTPFRRPVIIGSELVSFSALMTARHGGVQPVAMIEENARITAQRPADVLARMIYGTPVLLDTRLVAIRGGEKVEGVEIEQNGTRRVLDCDGVVFTGHFVPDAILARLSGIPLDAGTHGPMIDSTFRTLDPNVFAAGNVLRAVEHSGMAAREGQSAADMMLRALAGRLPDAGRAIPVTCGEGVNSVWPQRVYAAEHGRVVLHVSVECAGQDMLRLSCDDGRIVAERRVRSLFRHRLELPVAASLFAGVATLRLDLV
ncbi:NAD(P)/FAD-dependent oxidoreductase [Acetobacter conturbans]|uniref:NAD(P)-binding protein n=1 Tax=Acetobacter conturbans TaxID=1737472 RepID=A0ABX0K058_9PROT|nr:FAD/NAD(P)-binding oxidoreductase [Acetobacter conturbans]NHN89003.1 NAD(P)-binding protein [Acetobacter conturbans]